MQHGLALQQVMLLLCALCLFMIWCTYTWFKCYCMSRWLSWLLLTWCSHGYCDVINLVIVIYLGSRVLSGGPRAVVDLEFLLL